MIQDEILKLKKEKNAVILAHYYQDADIQDIADYVGDSLELSRIARDTDADMIVFCGVTFMAETAKILSPEKKVILPSKCACCPMARMVDKKRLNDYKKEHPDRVVICYVNSYAEVKALSDVCVTSSNAEKIIMHYKDEKMLYVPDKNLGNYLRDKYNLDIDLWPGFCKVHDDLRVEDVEKLRQEHPNAEVLIHPEAPLDVVKLADYVGSTKGIIEYATASDKDEFIIGTEDGIIHALQKRNPDKKFHILSPNLKCGAMKVTTMMDLYRALNEETIEITLDEETIKNAKRALDRMLELS